LLGIALALACYIVIFERGAGDGPETAQSRVLLPGFKRDQVTVIELTQTNQPPIRLRKTGSLWDLEAPLHYPAQLHAAERWLLLLEQAQWLVRLTPGEIQEEGATLADFGLAPPLLTVTLRSGAESQEVRLGNRLAVGRQFYLQLADQADIFILDSRLLEALPASPTAWRDTALVTFSSIAVSNNITFDRVEVRPQAKGYTLQPDPLSGWRIARPISARGDTLKIGQLVYSVIPNWLVTEFVTDDPNADLAAYGLQTPEHELVIGRGTNDLLTVQFGGSPTNRPELVYARLLRHTNIVLTARTNLDILRIPYMYWRDQLLVRLDPARVHEIIGTSGSSNSTYRVRRQTNDTWRVVEPELLVADTNLVAEFFTHMNSIEVGFEKDVVTDFAAYGLTEPVRQFSFLNGTNTPTNLLPTLSFGTNAAGLTFARRSDETSVYSVAPEKFYSLPLAHWQWRDRAIWNFQTNEVRRVRITQHGRTREVDRNPEGRWSLAPGSTGVLDLRFDEAIYQLSNLRADRWVWVGRAELGGPTFGFTNSHPHRVAIEWSRNGVLRTNTVEFGGVTAQGRPYAAVQLGEDRTWFFEFPMPLYYQFVLPSLTLPESP
jgi:hypothetical protein